MSTSSYLWLGKLVVQQHDRHADRGWRTQDKVDENNSEEYETAEDKNNSEDNNDLEKENMSTTD